MKKLKYFLSLLLLVMMFHGQCLAQGISGIATYTTSSSVDIQLDSTNMSPAQMKQIKDQLRKQLQRDYTLTFNATESTWKQEEVLGGGPAQASANGMQVMMIGSSDNEELYKNISEKRYLRTADLMGKLFLIDDELPNYEWKITNEKKKIGSYNCQKAIYTRVVDSKRFASGMDEMEVTKDTLSTTVWFTMDIPVSNGPNNLYGLPGLILEVQNGNRTTICTKVVLNPKEGISIEKPKKGKKVTEEEYNAISDKKMEEMMNRYSGGEHGESIEIRIGG